MFRKVLFWVIALQIWGFGNLLAQGQGPELVRVSGNLTDADTGEPLAFATVKLMKALDTTLVVGGIANAEGRFLLESRPGSYILDISFVGYSNQLMPLTLGANEPLVSIGEVPMRADSEELEEIVILGSRNKVEMGLDKRIFNVSDDLNNQGNSALEVIDNLPSVTVDVDGNVSLRGSQSVKILVDGKPSGLVGLDGTDGLRSLQGNIIDKIEVITNPSSKYDAEGSAGIINIVLKKDRQKGFNGSFIGRLGVPHDHGLSYNLNWRQGKFNLFSSLGIDYRSFPGGGSSFQQFFLEDSTFSTVRNTDRTRSGVSYNFRIGADYNLTDKDIFTASFLTSISDQDNVTQITYQDFDGNGDLFSEILRTDNEIEDEANYEYQLSYKHLFNNDGHELTADIQYRQNDEIEDSQLFEYDLMDDSGEPFLEQKSINKEGDRYLLTQLDYTNKISKDRKIEAGYRGTIRKITSDFQVTEKDENGDFQPIETLSNLFEYDENVYAFYGLYQDKLGKLGYQAGLRVEVTDIEIYQRETDIRDEKNYADLFPSAFLSYNFDKIRTLQLNYSRRITRPRFWYLNPFTSFSDPRNIRTGNIDLDPEYSDNFEFGLLNNITKATIYFGAYYRYTTDVIERIRVVNDEGITFSQPQNIGIEHSFGIELNGSYDPAKWLTLDGNFNFFRAITDGAYQDINLDRDTYSMQVNLTGQFKVKGYDLQLRGRYRAPENTTQGKRKSFYTLDFGASKDLLNNKATLTLNARDLFNTRRYRGTAEGDNFYSETDFQWRSRQVTLSFAYRLNQNKRKSRGGGRSGGGAPRSEF